jgi:trimeric autotransporter adhesin
MKTLKLVLITTLFYIFALPLYAADDGVASYIFKQNVGIKTLNPTVALDVNGDSLFHTLVNFNGQVRVNDSLRIPTGAQAGYVLVSDAEGNVSWSAATSLTVTGDDLGDHTAETNLNMANFSINNVGSITANNFLGGSFNGTFLGNGSALVGVNASTAGFATTAGSANIMNGGTISNSTITGGTINNANFNNPTINGATMTGTTIVSNLRTTAGGAGVGKVLGSDAAGNASWVDPTSLTVKGDDLGDHTATTDLNMDNNNIVNVKNITANTFNGGVFKGDGSALTNVKSSVFEVLENTIVNNGSEASYSNNFLIGSPTMDDTGTPAHDSKLFFNKSKGAFRAGEVDGNQWNNANVGQHSVAFGKNTRASGASSFAAGNGSVASNFSSFAFGYNNTASGPYAFALGFNTLANQNFSTAFGNSTEATAYRATAFGYLSRASGNGSTAFGKETLASGIGSTAFGQEAQAIGINSVSMGKNVRASGDQSFAIGLGNSNLDMLINDINNSLAIGFATNQPTLFVGPGVGGSTNGKVGIGTNSPQDLLDVDGRLRTKEFRMPTGAANDYVLTSDGVGVGTWKSIAAIGGTGDNLGNHIATTNLNMATNDINNVGSITANNFLGGSFNGTFLGNGSALVGVNASTAGFATIAGSANSILAENVPDLDAAKITTGIFDVLRIPNLDAAKITTGTLSIDRIPNISVAKIPDLDAAKITTGTFGVARIPNLDAAKITTGTLSIDRIPSITASKISSTGILTGRVLTSDGAGNVSWLVPPSGADNLGNHTATTNLNMANNNITNVGTVTGTTFIGALRTTAGGAAAGKVLTSDASGNATWQTPSGGVQSINDLSDAFHDNSNLYLGSAAGNGALGTENVALGLRAMAYTGNNSVYSVAIGSNALRSNSGPNANRNTAIGGLSMQSLTDGSYNTAIGANSLGANTGSDNVSIGFWSLGNANDSTENIAIGSRALWGTNGPVNPKRNVAIGHLALERGGSNNGNVAIGYNVGNILSSGNKNILIGYEVNTPTGFTNNFLNIGNLITGNLSGTKSAKIDGSLEATSIKLTTGAANNYILTSDASGNATWQTPSSGADNLGNHTATTTLNLNSNNITNVGSIATTSLTATNLNATTFNGTTFIGALRTTAGGAGVGKVLTSDASGNATWQNPPDSDIIQRGSGHRSVIINTFLGDPTLAPEATGAYAVTWGTGTRARGGSSLALGLSSVANGTLAFASGNATLAQGVASVAINQYSQALGANSFAANNNTRAIGNDSSAFGSGSHAIGTASAAFGGSRAEGIQSAAFGIGSKSNGEQAFAHGYVAKALGNSSSAWGYLSETTGFVSTVAGHYVRASGNYNFTIGKGYNFSNWLENNQAESFAVGFNSTIPTLIVTTNSTPAVTDGLGNVGIGTTSPSHRLHVIGTAGLSTGTTWTNTSDRRLKDIHGDYNKGLNEIIQLQPVEFSYKKDNLKKLPSDINIVGFIAQDVEPLFPEAINTGEDGYLEFTMHSINVAMVNAIKQLKSEKDQEINKLKELDSKKDSEIAELKEQVSLLRALYCKEHSLEGFCD